MYLLLIPKFIRHFLPDAIYELNDTHEKSVYLTFDDGPIPEVTPFVLQELKKYNAKATFFMVGDNVVKYPEIFEQVVADGHSFGNHTFSHINGRKSNTEKYLEDVARAQRFLDTNLFRPPYGMIKNKQAKKLQDDEMQMVMWSVLSGDFDSDITSERCLENVLLNIKPGDIVVFHDSIKAFHKLLFVLPRVLAFCVKKDWMMKAIPMIKK